MPAPDSILKLVDHFAALTANLRQARYNETQTRREFIDPFFEALGWDVSNRAGYSEAYKDVIHEDALAVEGRSRAPDYAFRVGGRRVFFVEAKKPSVNLSEGHAPAFQLRRYAWTAKLPLSILTDFEEFAVYDCRSKPNPADKPAQHRLMLLNYRDYPARWDELYNIFSKEAVLQGRFDAYAETSRGKKGTADVDDDFLATIEGWRKALALNLALRNPSLTERDLNYAVQMTIDRILFLRIAEERGIERTDQLKDIAAEGEIYAGLVQLYRLADQRYNSGLFHFGAEKNRSTHPDTLTPALAVDDRVLKEIIRGLYPPLCPYAWYVLPAEILGQVYEQFLGRVIRLTPGHQAKVEEKPEVRKAGGVYYTPGYIVDYIVQQTVGRLLEGKTPAEASRLKIVDPACGSGSFLLGAYQHLLDWHLAWYTANNPASHARGAHPAVFETRHGWALTTDKKKEILLHSIYGVDIDPQAVEVTKLSLLLKVLEGDLPAAGDQLGLRLERLLPDLGGNIQCGNSLIGTDYYANRQMGLGLVDDAERYRVNAFDWQRAFPQVFQQGGFDAVIGNPPYVDIKGLPTDEVRYLFSKYSSANNRINLFAIFVEKSLEIVNPARFQFSMIVPTAIFTQESYKALRRGIASKLCVNNIVRIPNESFGSSAGEVKVDTAIIVISNNTPSKVEIVAYSGYKRITEINASEATVHSFVDQDDWLQNQDFVWSFAVTDRTGALIKKCEQGTTPLEECADFCLGITPYDKYKGHTPSQIKNQVFHANFQKDETFKKLLAGNDVRRYSIQWNGTQWISYGPWLGAPRESRFFTQKRILVKQIIDWTTKRIWASITEEELYNTQNAFNLIPKPGWSAEYLLGILNSRLMTFYHQKKYLDEFKMRFQKILIKDCRRFPIRTINFSDPAEAALHSRMVALVEQMLSLHARRAAAHNPQELEHLTRQIETVDRTIDALVYQLYNLTDDEIRLVEGGN